MGAYDWVTTEPPWLAQLSGVEAHGDDAFAVGNRGLLLERRGEGNWDELVPGGPTGNNTNLNDVALTDDGRRLWYGGDSGAFGYYDREAEEAFPHTAPKSNTDGFRAIAVRGPAGREVVHAVDDDGRVVRATVDDETVDVTDETVPNDGASFTAIVEYESYRYAADASGCLLRSTDGVDWQVEQLVDTTIEGLAVAADGVTAATDDGELFRGVSLFGETGRTGRADLGDESPEDLAAEGETFAVVGDDAAVLVIGSNGDVIRAGLAADEMLHGVEIMPGGRYWPSVPTARSWRDGGLDILPALKREDSSVGGSATDQRRQLAGLCALLWDFREGVVSPTSCGRPTRIARAVPSA
jgi:hypothetical protein